MSARSWELTADLMDVRSAWATSVSPFVLDDDGRLEVVNALRHDVWVLLVPYPWSLESLGILAIFDR